MEEAYKSWLLELRLLTEWSAALKVPHAHMRILADPDPVRWPAKMHHAFVRMRHIHIAPVIFLLLHSYLGQAHTQPP
jgi:hypothetical protein